MPAGENYRVARVLCARRLWMLCGGAPWQKEKGIRKVSCKWVNSRVE